MGLLRNRHPELNGTRFQLRERIFDIGDDFWIENDSGDRQFKVNGKALRIRSTFKLENSAGDELFKIQEKKLRVRDTMDIERGGQTVATVKKALISPLRHRFTIHMENGDELSAHGNIVDHEYEIERGDDKVANVSKRWFRVRDTYGIEVAEGENEALILAIAVCIDEMTER
jgi:uncharacterized protein YxjI